MSEKTEEAVCILLGQKLSARYPELKDYACNLYADKIASIDVILESEKLTNEDRETLEFIKKVLIKKGLALWIMKSDILTNLAIKLGKTARTISLSRET